MMALSAIRHGRTLRLVRAFASSILASPSTAALGSGSNSNAGAGLSHLFGHSNLYGCQRPSVQWRHMSSDGFPETFELKNCKHWYISLKFPKDPAPTREEMIATYVRTLANVLGSEEEAKRKIYALSTTTYTGFQCNIDEATSEKLKEQPYVNWVLPDGYGIGVFRTGDRYDNGVITPDPDPPRPYNERPRERNFDRPRFDRPRDFRPMEGRDNMQREQRPDNRPPFEQRGPMQGYQRDNMQPDDRRGPMPPMDRRDSYQGERRGPMPPINMRGPYQGEQRGPMPPIDRRDSYQGEQRDTVNEEQGQAVRGGGQY